MMAKFSWGKKKGERDGEDKTMSLDLGQISSEVLDRHLRGCVLQGSTWNITVEVIMQGLQATKVPTVSKDVFLQDVSHRI